MRALTPTEIESTYAARREGKPGGHFFDPETKRFFSSRTGSGFEVGERVYFITSEQGPHMPRLWTHRVIEPDGAVRDIGGFQAYATRDQARRRLVRAVRLANHLLGGCRS
jgi:hypothetical protein